MVETARTIELQLDRLSRLPFPLARFRGDLLDCGADELNTFGEPLCHGNANEISLDILHLVLVFTLRVPDGLAGSTQSLNFRANLDKELFTLGGDYDFEKRTTGRAKTGRSAMRTRSSEGFPCDFGIFFNLNVGEDAEVLFDEVVVELGRIATRSVQLFELGRCLEVEGSIGVLRHDQVECRLWELEVVGSD